MSSDPRPRGPDGRLLPQLTEEERKRRKAERGRRWREQNPEKARAARERWAAANPDRIQANRVRSRAKNREQDNAKARQRYAADAAYRAQHNAAGREWYAQNRDRHLANTQRNIIRRRHGLEPDELQAIWDSQAGQCYLCGEDLGPLGPAVHLDHDHRCCPHGMSCSTCRRGLACQACNLIVGLAEDNADRLVLIATNLRPAIEAVTTRLATTTPQEALFDEEAS